VIKTNNPNIIQKGSHKPLIDRMMKLIADLDDIDTIENISDACCNVSNLKVFPGETIITPIATAVPIKMDPIKYDLCFLCMLLSINNMNNSTIPNKPICKAAYDSDNPATKNDMKNRNITLFRFFFSVFPGKNIIRSRKRRTGTGRK
jgi:hypothetical protein